MSVASRFPVTRVVHGMAKRRPDLVLEPLAITRGLWDGKAMVEGFTIARIFYPPLRSVMRGWIAFNDMKLIKYLFY